MVLTFKQLLYKALTEKWTVYVGLNIKGAEELAIPGGEKPSDFHVTLLWGRFAPTGDEDDAYVRVQSALEDIRDTFPDQLKFDDLGRFPASASSDGKDVIYARVAEGQLEEVHKELVKKLKEKGIKVERTFSEYKPHMTLAYIDPDREYTLIPIDTTGQIVSYTQSIDDGVHGKDSGTVKIPYKKFYG